MLHHIGIIVRNIYSWIEELGKIGYEPVGGVTTDMIQNNLVVFLKAKQDTCLIELIQPISEESSVCHAREGLHHLCWTCENFDSITVQYKEHHIGKVFTKPIQAPAIEGREVFFGCTKKGLLTEYVIMN